MWLVELPQLTNGDQLAHTITGMLSTHDEPGYPRESLSALLATRRLLLVLDNCEHMLTDCADLVSALVSAAPELRILATSREALRVPGEQILTVPALTVPDEDDLPADAATQYEALTLFADRARALEPDFTITADNTATLARLCRRLDGIPLAIELAAAWLTMFSPQEILNHLDDRFHLLTGGWRTAPARHHTMRAAIDWSHDLCTPTERLLWARMSVFVGGSDLDDIEAICCDDHDEGITRTQLMNVLAALVRKSIVSSVHSHGHTRYRMLETIRQYGQERLAESGHDTDMRCRHRDYYRTAAAKEAAHWFGPSEADYLARIQRDWPNLLTALDYCVTQPDSGENAHVALDMASNLVRGRAAFFGGRLAEARTWLHRALELNPQPSPARARGLALLAWIGLFQGDGIGSSLTEARSLAHQINDDGVHASVLYVEGVTAFFRADPHAIDLLTQSRERNLAAGEIGDAHMALMFQALAAVFLGDRQEALDTSAACLNDARTHRADWAMSSALWITAIAQWLHGDRDQAPILLKDALERARTHGDRWVRIWGIEAHAWLAADHGHYTRAAHLLGASARQRQEMGVLLAILTPWNTAHIHCVNTVRGHLGSNDYHREYQHGSRLSADEAMRLALNEPKTTHTTTPPETDNELTPREREVAQLIAQGLSNKAIAARLVISKRTADSHIDHILTKLGFTNRAQITAWVYDHRPNHQEPLTP